MRLSLCQHHHHDHHYQSQPTSNVEVYILAIPWWLPWWLPWRLINPDILMMKTSLLFGWQYVFPSPMYPSLQEHLNEPSVFEQDARFWRQSCDPCTHSSRSKNGKENRLFPEKMPGKISCDGTEKTQWNSTREREREGGGGGEGRGRDKRHERHLFC